jgi:hypothetical protein
MKHLLAWILVPIGIALTTLAVLEIRDRYARQAATRVVETESTLVEEISALRGAIEDMRRQQSEMSRRQEIVTEWVRGELVDKVSTPVSPGDSEAEARERHFAMAERTFAFAKGH